MTAHPPPVQRIPVADLVFLVEEEITPQTIALLARFSTTGDGPAVETLRETITSRLPAIPSLCRRVQHVPWWQGRPLWVDDDAFDIDRHVRAEPVPSPGDEAAVLRVVGRLITVPFDPRHPLWDLVLLDAGAGGRWMLWRLHHVVADGERALWLLAALIDPGLPLGDPPASRSRWAPPPGILDGSWRRSPRRRALARRGPGRTPAFAPSGRS